MTQEKLAELVNLSPGQISDLEQGLSGYSPESLMAIAEALKTSRGNLLDVAPPLKGQAEAPTPKAPRTGTRRR